MTLIILLLILVAVMSYPIVELIKSYLSVKNNEITKLQGQLVPVSVILNVYNEEKNITRKIEELLNEPIWIKGSELLIVSGGSSDNTNRLISNLSCLK